MKWLVTGGCGFIGTNLVRRLLEQNHSIRVIDNLTVGTRDDLASACEFVEIDSVCESMPALRNDLSQSPVQLIVGDILNEDLARKVTQDIEVVVHLAANTGVGPSVANPRLDCVTNVLGTLNYLESARMNRVKRFVFASSGAPVGECVPPIHEEMAPHPVSPYGASKLAGEAYCSAYFRTFALETVALRFGNIYGPASSHKGSVVAKFIKNILEEVPLEIYGDGRQTRDFIYVDDLLSAIQLAAVQENVGGEIFQIATNSETTVAELAQQLTRTAEHFGFRTTNIVHSPRRLGDVLRNYSDTTKAGARLGWQSTTSLEQGLKKTFEWFVATSGNSTTPQIEAPRMHNFRGANVS